MDSPRIFDHPLPAQIFSSADLDGAVSALLTNPRAQVLMVGESRTIDVSAVVRADDYASLALASLNDSMAHRRMAVRTAILLAHPNKA